jgi:PAT family beta-lactamase induction signal transducer AmpG
MARKVPVWLLGFANLPLGVTGGVALILTPQVLAGRHVPEPRIADITTLALMATFGGLLIVPVLDVRFSRRTYAIVLSILTAALTGASVLSLSNLDALGVWLFLAILAAQLHFAAIGGWFGSVIPKDKDAALGAWITVANVVGAGATAMAGILLVRAAPIGVAATVLGGLNLLPLVVYAFAQPPTEERRRLTESFSQFARDLGALVRNAAVLRLLLLFALPGASFALTNTLGGLGADYHASEQLVGVVFGAGIAVAGVAGSLAVPLLARRAPPLWVYIGVGATGASLTLLNLVLPHTTPVFIWAAITQNVWQAAALSLVSAIALQSIGKDNPVAATQFGLLQGAAAAPITYMQWLDGHAYGAAKLTGMYLTDGGLGMIACVSMAAMFAWVGRRGQRIVTPALDSARERSSRVARSPTCSSSR